MEGLKPDETLYRWYTIGQADAEGKPTGFAFKLRRDEVSLSFWRGDEAAILEANPGTGIAAITVGQIEAAFEQEHALACFILGDDGHVLLSALPGKAHDRVARLLRASSRVVRLPRK